MKKTILIMFTLALFTLATSPLMAHGKTMVVKLKGKAQGFTRNVPTPDGGKKKANCFRVPMYDVPTGLQLGHAFDCLHDEVADGDGGVTVTDTVIFRPARNGRLVAYGKVSIRPLQDKLSAPDFTHITGSVPKLGDKNIITRKGTKRFKGLTGAVRLSGAVNLSKLATRNVIEFDCLFVIELDDVNADDFERLGDLKDTSEEEEAAAGG